MTTTDPTATAASEDPIEFETFLREHVDSMNHDRALVALQDGFVPLAQLASLQDELERAKASIRRLLLSAPKAGSMLSPFDFARSLERHIRVGYLDNRASLSEEAVKAIAHRDAAVTLAAVAKEEANG